MPTIIGGKSGTRPYLELDWSITSQDIANNRSNINLKLYLRVEYNIGYNARYTGVLQGSSFTANAGYLSKPGRYLLAERNITVGHNSDGTKTQSFSASYNISINWSSTYYSSISLSGSGTLTPIPRGSTLSAFSFASTLQVGVANTINYTVARHSSTYRHQLQLRDGSVTIATWDNVSSNGSTTLGLTAAQVNTILGRMSTVTSKSFTLRLATRSGINGGWIGSVVTRNANATVNDNVKPSISSTSAVPTGNSWAVNKGYFVQGQTGVQAQFSSTASGGAGVKSRSISIGSLSSGGSVVGSVFRHSHSRVNVTGTVSITYTITDTRGRSASSKRDITVRAYTPPQITSFTVGRSNPTSSTVTVKSTGSIHGMAGVNTGTMTVKQQGVTNNVRTISLSNTTPSFNDSFNRTVATASSVDFTITVTDLLGNSASSTTTVGTAFMEFSIRKGKGVGIGKVHEKGVLDVDGEIYLRGALDVDPPTSDNRPVLKLNSGEDNGFGFLEFFNNVGTRAGYLGVATARDSDLRNMITVGADPLLNKGVNFRGSDINFMDTPIMEYGTGGTNTGYYVRFYNGLQICWGAVEVSGNGLTNVNMAATFKDNHYGLSAVALAMASSGNSGLFVTEANVVTGKLIHIKKLLVAATGETIRYTVTGGARYTAIGMWK